MSERTVMTAVGAVVISLILFTCAGHFYHTDRDCFRRSADRQTVDIHRMDPDKHRNGFRVEPGVPFGLPHPTGRGDTGNPPF